MSNFFANLLLGHLVGDFLLQPKSLAMNKNGNSFKCFAHCVIYTISVGLATWSNIHTWQWWGLIFLSHFPIDRWSLADKWLDLIGSRSLKDYLANGWKDCPSGIDVSNYHALRGGFTALVYCVADNTMHLCVMFWGVTCIQ